MKLTIDSNVLVYSVDSAAGPRHLIASELLVAAGAIECVLTLQSLAEFVHVTTRKKKLDLEKAEHFVNLWRAVFPVVVAGEQNVTEAIALVRRYGCSFWDAMLLATARHAGCGILLSEDLQDGQTLGSVTCMNPFAAHNAVRLMALLSHR